MTTSTKNQEPVVQLRDGNIKIAIWKNESEKGGFYSISPAKRSYKDKEDKYQDTTSLSGSQILKAKRLLGQAYDTIVELDAADYAARKKANNQGS